MKKTLLFFILLINFATLSKSLTIYTYSSFNSEWGPGPKVFPIFEKQCDCKLNIISFSDTGQLLARFLLEQKNPKADLLLGLNDTHLPKLQTLDLFSSYTGKNYNKLAKKLHLDKGRKFIVFDYGNLAFIYDSEKISDPPKSLDDLLDSRFKDKIVIESPISSAPGLSFLHWTIKKYGENEFSNYWEKLTPNLISISNSWSAAYGMFTKGETPLVLSYTTSPAYHLINEKVSKFKAAIFENGHYPQIEFATIVKSSKRKKTAQKFMDFLLSPEFQNIIPTTNWMYPAIKYQQLPAAFNSTKSIKSIPLLDSKLIQKNQRKWLKTWSLVIQKAK